MLILFIVLIGFLLLFKIVVPYWKNNKSIKSNVSVNEREIYKQERDISIDKCDKNSKKEDEVKEVETIIYTKHALERMKQRNISKEDIEKVIEKGVINKEKSTLKAINSCPIIAKQGFNEMDDTCVRVIYSKCASDNYNDNTHKFSNEIITTYNLKKSECSN